MRLSKRIEKLEGQQVPRPMLIGVRNLDGTVWADVPAETEKPLRIPNILRAALRS